MQFKFLINYLSSRRGCWFRSSCPRGTRWAGGCRPETRTCTSPRPGPCHTPGPPGPRSSGGWSFAPVGQTSDDSYPRDRGHYQESAWKSRFVTQGSSGAGTGRQAGLAHGCWYFVNTGEISLRPCHISLNGWLGSYQSHVLVNVISLPKNKNNIFWTNKRKERGFYWFPANNLVKIPNILLSIFYLLFNVKWSSIKLWRRTLLYNHTTLWSRGLHGWLYAWFGCYQWWLHFCQQFKDPSGDDNDDSLARAWTQRNIFRMWSVIVAEIMEDGAETARPGHSHVYLGDITHDEDRDWASLRIKWIEGWDKTISSLPCSSMTVKRVMTT